MSVADERVLHPRIQPELVVLSFCISWLGAYTSIQLHIHAGSHKDRTMYWLWSALASIAFGFCAIWSMHYLGMLACKFDVAIDFNKPLTALSALVAIFLTFSASLSNDAWRMRFLSHGSRWLVDALRCRWLLARGRIHDAEYVPLFDSDGSAFALEPPASRDDSHHRVDARRSTVNGRRSRVELGPLRADMNDDDDDSSDPDMYESPGSESGSGNEEGDSLETKEWKPWLLEQYAQISVFHFVRAVVLASAIDFMFYLAMWAMEIENGRIEWHPGKMFVSYLVTLALCLCACVAMLRMEVNIGRQVIVATLSASSVCSMHYFGMEATTMFTRAPPSAGTGFPAYLTWTIIGGAIIVCILANALLANRAIVARHRMADAIRTKRKLWRLLAEKDAAERAHELKQQFISVASHEIRTPLHTISGYAELLMLTNLTQEQLLYLNNIKQACHAVNMIAENVLDFGKLERGNAESQARPVPVEPRKIMDSVAQLAATSEPKHGSTVETVISVSPKVPIAMQLDETYILRVLMNLYSNAAKFTESGFISISLDVDSEQRRLMATVRDTGMGIPPGFREAMFEPFRQADSSLTRAHHGAGLGLSIVQQLVQSMRGTITVDSILGGGSTFTITLPTEPANPTRPLTPPVPSHRRRVKVVCSDPRAERLYVDLWRQYGHEAAVASPRGPPEDLYRKTDLVWADAESVKTYSTLMSLMAVGTAKGRIPQLCIVHSRTEELVNFGPGVKSDTVHLIKRPIVMHAVIQHLDAAERLLEKEAEPSQVPEAPLDPPLIDTSTIIRSPDPPLAGPVVDVNTVMTPEPSSRFIPDRTRKGKVLLVEDNLINQRLGRRLVEKLGYDVVTADNGQDAVERIMKEQFNLCLMDCQMPVLDGFAATQKIREMELDGTLPGRMRIIALTANVSYESEDRCRLAGMDHFLPKPLRLDALEAALRIP